MSGGAGARTMRLTNEERAWLDAYRRVLAEEFPGLVERLLIYGSKARGDDRPDSDLDVLVLIREGDWRLKESVAARGDDLSLGTDVVASMLVFTAHDWERMGRRESVFREAVERDGVSVA